jgi:hypothetical protein
MERRIGEGTTSFFVRFLGVVRDRDIYGKIQANDLQWKADNPIEPGAENVGGGVLGDVLAWVQESTLPFAYINSRPNYAKSIQDAYNLLEQHVRKQTGAVEVYSKAGVDELLDAIRQPLQVEVATTKTHADLIDALTKRVTELEERVKKIEQPR